MLEKLFRYITHTYILTYTQTNFRRTCPWLPTNERIHGRSSSYENSILHMSIVGIYVA